MQRNVSWDLRYCILQYVVASSLYTWRDTDPIAFVLDVQIFNFHRWITGPVKLIRLSPQRDRTLTTDTLRTSVEEPLKTDRNWPSNTLGSNWGAPWGGLSPHCTINKKIWEPSVVTSNAHTYTWSGIWGVPGPISANPGVLSHKWNITCICVYHTSFLEIRIPHLQ
jgi:hypothetical protein